MVGVIVGFVIGYTIDRLFGTAPWGMIVFTGFAPERSTCCVRLAWRKIPVGPSDRSKDGGVWNMDGRAGPMRHG